MVRSRNLRLLRSERASQRSPLPKRGAQLLRAGVAVDDGVRAALLDGEEGIWRARARPEDAREPGAKPKHEMSKDGSCLLTAHPADGTDHP